MTATQTATQPLTQLEFVGSDFATAERIAKSLGYEQTVYTSTSSLWGLFCLKENPEYWKGSPRALTESCIIKTRELGFLVVSNLEQLNLDEDGRRS